MHTTRLFTFLALGVGLLCSSCSAAETAPIDGAQAPSLATDPIRALETRDAWFASQALVRTVMRVSITPKPATGQPIDLPLQTPRPPEQFLMLIERTPKGRARIVIKDTVTGPARLTYLVQDSTSLAISGENSVQPAASWMLGHYIFEQLLEPLMLLNWTMGLPGKDYALDASIAELDVQDESLAGLTQAGWQVSYDDWKSSKDRPALPQLVHLVGEHVEVALQVADIETFAKPPADYTEFDLR